MSAPASLTQQTLLSFLIPARYLHALHEFKEGDLHIGKSGKKVKSRKQAVAIAIDKARRKGLKVPKKSK